MDTIYARRVAAAAAVTILNARGMRFEQQRAAVHIDQVVTLAAVDLLARIAATWIILKTAVGTFLMG